MNDHIDFDYEVTPENTGSSRLIKQIYPDLQNPGTDIEISYTYGTDSLVFEKGRLISTTDEAGSMAMDYGRLGEVVSSTRNLNVAGEDQSFTISTEYDNLNRVKTMTYPDMETLTYSYNRAGQVESLSGLKMGNPYTYVHNVDYDAFGQRIDLWLGNETRESFQYEEVRRLLSRKTVQHTTGTTLMDLSYDFEDNGNIRGRRDSVHDVMQSYTYDSLNRLRTAQGNAGTLDTTYTGAYDYDSLHRFTLKAEETSFTSAENIVTQYPVNRLSYTYSNSNLRTYMTPSGSTYSVKAPYQMTEIRRYLDSGQTIYEAISQEFDLNGNLTSRLTQAPSQFGGMVSKMSHDVDVLNRIKSTTQEVGSTLNTLTAQFEMDFLYSNNGKRLRKHYTSGSNGGNSPSDTRETAYPFQVIDLNGFVNDDLDNYEQYKHYFINRERILTKLRSDNAIENVNFFYHDDHLGSSTLITDSNGQEYSYSEYYPYGSQWINNNKKELSNPSSGLKHYFTSHEYDKETQLYYMLARYYDPETGGFLSSDPAMDGIDSYHYVKRNPLKYKDPNGEIPVDTVLDIAFMTYDAVEMVFYVITGDWKSAEISAEALGADALSALVPYFAGGGLVVRGAKEIAKHSDEVAKGIKALDKALETGEGLVKGSDDIAEYATKKAKDARKAQLRREARSVIKESRQITLKSTDSVHHKLPLEFVDKFEKAGINLNNPLLLKVIENHSFDAAHWAYNRIWEKWLYKNQSVLKAWVKNSGAKAYDDLAKMADEFWDEASKWSSGGGGLTVDDFIDQLLNFF